MELHPRHSGGIASALQSYFKGLVMRIGIFQGEAWKDSRLARAEAPRSLLRDRLFQKDHGRTRRDPVDMDEVRHRLVLGLFHVEAVHGAHVDALLAPDALRVVELEDHDRLPLPEVRPIDHVDAPGRALSLALPAPDAHVDLDDRFLPDAVHE